MKRILIIDDEIGVCKSLYFALNEAYDVSYETDVHKALTLIRESVFDLCLLDLRIGTYNGIEMLRKIKVLSRATLVIIMTAYGSIETSVEAIKNGAYTYITKPINIAALDIVLDQAFEYQELNIKVEQLSQALQEQHNHSGMIGKSPAMQGVFKMIEKVKDVDSSVLITGESGTGKELVARAIHDTGRRKHAPFWEVNCAAIPEGLLETELFGHKKGSFSGAVEDQKGKFELADNGTIFLDEIAELPYNLQAKLLRVLQEKTLTPIGSSKKIALNIRVIAATNKDLRKLIQKNLFREDLFFRLNVINIALPTLSQRKQDIPLLVDYFIRRYNLDFGKSIRQVSGEAMQTLLKYPYPGNIRQLSNMLEHAVVMAEGDTIEFEDLPTEITCGVGRFHIERNFPDQLVGMRLKEIERIAIEATLKSNGGQRRTTAEMLGISEKGLFNKIKEYEIECVMQ